MNNNTNATNAINDNNDDKYIIYKTDLKHRDLRQIDPNKVIYNDEETETLFNLDLDTLKYRLKECKLDNNNSLDLNRLDLTVMPDFTSSLFLNLTYLSILGNNLTKLPDLTFLSNLKIFDCSHNELNLIVSLPKTLIEMDCSHNNLTTIDCLSKCDQLLRLKCTHNKIQLIPVFKKLKILHCQNNYITSIPCIQYLVKLFCTNNQISIIYNLPSIEYIDCRNNLINAIEPYYNLTELYINNNKLVCIPYFPKIIVLECMNNNIKKIQYISTLNELVCDYNNLKISTKFKIIENIIVEQKYSVLRFK